MSRSRTLAILCLLTGSLRASAETADLFSLHQQGAQLSAGDVRKLEKQLPSATDPLSVHAQLAGYYGQKRGSSKKAMQTWTDHVAGSSSTGRISTSRFSGSGPTAPCTPGRCAVPSGRCGSAR